MFLMQDFQKCGFSIIDIIMKRIVKIISTLVILLVVSCSKEISESFISSEISESKANLPTRANGSIDYAIDNHVTLPYHLDGMQEKFNHFVDQKNREGADLSYIELTPTHYAIKLNVTTIDEVHRLESDRSLAVSDLPFGSTTEPDFDPSELLNPIKPSSPNIIWLSSLHNRECSIHEESEDPITICPLYTYWPVNKSFPTDISYEICYPAFIPGEAINYRNNQDIVEDWLRCECQSRTETVLQGTLYGYDNRLGQNIPIRNAMIRVGPSRLDLIETDDNGQFSLPGTVIPEQTSLVLWLEGGRSTNSWLFSVRDGSSSACKRISLGLVSDLWGNNTSANIYLPNSFEVNIYQAAWYYYNGNNSLLNAITKYHSSTNDSPDIHAMNTTGNYYGLFHYAQNGSYLQNPYIEIYNYSSSASFIFGTVLHEIGHATYYTMEGATSMDTTKDFIHESFASFFGWYNVLSYYSSVASSHSTVNSICSQSRQTWTPSSLNLDYTPLYIDLFDNINQSTYYSNSSLVNDNISSVPISAILNSSLGPSNLNEVNTALSSYVGTYFSLTNYNSFISNYYLANFN